MSVSRTARDRFRIPNEDITWAGDCPWTGGYCLGTQNGKVLFCKRSADALAVEFGATLTRSDAINGIAFHDEYIGVSTPSEVVVHRRVSESGFETIADAPGGAHGIVATPSGLFIAPMGIDGLYVLDMRLSTSPNAWNGRARGAVLNYYTATYLGSDGAIDRLAFAGRTDGLIKLQLDPDYADRTQTNTLTAPNVDVVDVCALGNDRWPFAVAALRRDGPVILVRDIRSDEPLETLELEGIQGTPYSIRCAQGHIFILTSEMVEVIPNLARAYLEREPLDERLHSRRRSVEAVDMFITHGDELLVVTDQEIEIDDIARLVEPLKFSPCLELPSSVSEWSDQEDVSTFSQFSAQWKSNVA